MKENMTKYEETLDVDGKFQIPAVLFYNDSEWEINYYFEPVKLDVVVTGTITDGKLAIVTDNSGYCAPMLPVFQGMYENALKA